MAPTDGVKTLATTGVTATDAKFIVYGLTNGGTSQVPSTIDEVVSFLSTKYGATINTEAIQLTEGNITIKGKLLSTEDWNKIKAGGDNTIPYRITLVKDSSTAPVTAVDKVLKIAIYEDGNAVLENLQASKQAGMELLTTLNMG